MKKLLVSTFSIILFITVLFIYSENYGNSNTHKITKANYPVKIHISGSSDGELFIINTDGGTSQTTNKSSFLLNLNTGNHSICIKSSGNKWGYIIFNRDNNPMIQDIYVDLQNHTLNNSPCNNIK